MIFLPTCSIAVLGAPLTKCCVHPPCSFVECLCCLYSVFLAWCTTTYCKCLDVIVAYMLSCVLCWLDVCVAHMLHALCIFVYMYLLWACSVLFDSDQSTISQLHVHILRSISKPPTYSVHISKPMDAKSYCMVANE